jgi:hypothetical protein
MIRSNIREARNMPPPELFRERLLEEDPPAIERVRAARAISIKRAKYPSSITRIQALKTQDRTFRPTEANLSRKRPARAPKLR